jgi:hypothetical protein
MRIPKGTPPIFLAHGGDNIISSPEHRVVLYLALKRAGVPALFTVRPGIRVLSALPLIRAVAPAAIIVVLRRS